MFERRIAVLNIASDFLTMYSSLKPDVMRNLGSASGLAAREPVEIESILLLIRD